MSHQDQVFMRTFTIVLVILAAMGLAFYFIAQNVSKETGGTSSNKMAEKAVEDRIAPVGQVNVGAAKAAGATGARSGKELVAGVCASCHATGVLGAPKEHNKADWEPRLKNGIDALVKSAIHGKGAMPPRGGSNYTDEEMKKAIEFMTKF